MYKNDQESKRYNKPKIKQIATTFAKSHNDTHN